MKKLTLLLAVIAISTMTFAQGAAPLSKGGRQLNFGLGFNDGGIPLYIGMDWAVHNDITVGGMLSFNLDGFDYGTGPN